MSTVSIREFTSSNANASSYANSAFTPTEGDLLVVVIELAGSLATDGTLTASANGITFTDCGQHPVGNSSANTHYIFVANQKVPASPVSMTLTFDCTSDAATGCSIVTLAVTGNNKVGSAAIKQAAGQSDRVASQTPTIVFPANITAGNVVIGAATNNANPAAITEPTGWTEDTDNGHAQPTTGIEVAHIDSHVGGTDTVAWGAVSATRGGGIAIEIDTAVAGTPVGKDLSLVWNVKQAVGKSSQLVWNTLANGTPIGKDLQLVWNTKAVIGKNNQLVWNTKAVIGKNNQLVWNVKTRVGKDNQLVWNTRQVVGKSSQLVWNTLANTLTAGKNLVLVWNTRQAIGKDNQLKWNVLTKVNKDLILQWRVLTMIGKARQFVWNTRQAIGKELRLLWNTIYVAHWTEQNSSVNSWSELPRNASVFSEDSQAGGIWTEVPSDNQSWTEQ